MDDKILFLRKNVLAIIMTSVFIVYLMFDTIIGRLCHFIPLLTKNGDHSYLSSKFLLLYRISGSFVVRPGAGRHFMVK